MSVFASKFDPSLTAEQLKAYLTSKLNIEVICDKLDTVRKRFSSFKITAECEDPVILLNAELWPEGAYVRTFYEKRGQIMRYEEEYLTKLGQLSAVIDDIDTTCITVVGDFSANAAGADSCFWNHLRQFCLDNNLTISTVSMLPGDSFTYVSDSWYTVSWLDHCICTADADKIIANVDIWYDYAITDHIPFHVACDIDCLPVLSN